MATVNFDHAFVFKPFEYLNSVPLTMEQYGTFSPIYVSTLKYDSDTKNKGKNKKFKKQKFKEDRI
jgi:hypothetical protein